MLDIAIAIVWVAAVYRLWMSLSLPPTLWRTSFTFSLVATAVAFTLYRWRLTLDAATRIWNLGGLAAHLIFTIGLGFLLIYLDSLRRLKVPRRVVLLYLVVTCAVLLAMLGSWVVAPLHDQEVDDLLPLAGSGAVTLYCASFWIFLAGTLVVMVRTCLARGRTFRHEDLARSVSMLLIGVAAILGILIATVWTVAVAVSHQGGDPGAISRLGDALLPWPVLLLAVGVLALLVIPYVDALVRAWWQWRQLRPLWTELTRRYPDTHLIMDLNGGPLNRMEMRVERAIIETRDALRFAPVDAPTRAPLPVTAVALALRCVQAGSVSAAEVLQRAETREADVEQLIELAQAFRKFDHAPA